MTTFHEVKEKQLSRAQRLERALRELLEFAEQNGPARSARYSDWSPYFEAAHAALKPEPGQETYEQLQARMERAFALVKPQTHWKDPIDAYVEVSIMNDAGLGAADIREAIEYFTATVSRAIHDGAGTRFIAAGYRAGPAGP